MADDSGRKPRRTQQASARLYVVDVEELKRRAESLPGQMAEVGWTVYLREFLHEQLKATKRKKIQ